MRCDAATLAEMLRAFPHRVWPLEQHGAYFMEARFDGQGGLGVDVETIEMLERRGYVRFERMPGARRRCWLNGGGPLLA